MKSSSNQSTNTKEWIEMQKQYLESLINAQNAFANNSMNNKYPFGFAQRRADNMFQQWQNEMFNGGMNNPNFAADMFRNQFASSNKDFFDAFNRFNGQGTMKTPDQVAVEWGMKMQEMLAEIMNNNGSIPLSSMDPLNFIASIPGVGPNRLKQEMLADLYKKWSYFQQTSFIYFQGIAKIAMEANMAWSDYVINPPEDAEPLETPRQIVDKWIAISEKTYAKYALSEEYMTLYGNTINALSAYKAQLNKVMDSVMDEFGLPTRKELDSVHKYVTQLKRDNAAMKKELQEIKTAMGMKSATKTKTVAANASTLQKVANSSNDKQAAKKGK